MGDFWLSPCPCPSVVDFGRVEGTWVVDSDGSIPIDSKMGDTLFLRRRASIDVVDEDAGWCCDCSCAHTSCLDLPIKFHNLDIDDAYLYICIVASTS